MKTFAGRGVFEATVYRFAALSPDSRPVWGVMSASRMVTHLHGAFGMAMRYVTVAPRLVPFAFAARLFVLRSGIPWPHNIATVPELDFARMPDRPELFSRDCERLIERMNAFTGPGSEALLYSHPMLGPMSRWEWMRWGYLHTDHHLRQFGC